jgi:Dolichyl-phosphate-mannose-protein mannosyltransferase
VSFGEYVLGLLLLGATAGGCWLVARIVVGRRLPREPAHVRGAAFGVVLAAALLAATLLPATLGLLGRASGPVCALLLLAAVHASVRRRPAGADPPPRPDREPLMSRLLGRAGLVLAGGWSLAAAWYASAIPSAGLDSLTFHLPVSVRWMQTGTIWRVDQYLPLFANGYYPQNGDALNLALIEPFRSDAFVRVLSALSLPVLVLAVYALARELRAPRGAAWLGAALVGSLPITVLTAEEGAKTDLWCVAALTVAGLFLLRHLRSRSGDDLLLGALALGLGFGTKWYGVTAAVVIAVAWAGARVWQRPRAGVALRDAGAVAAVCALGGGLWLVRNWVESGNPLFPARVGVAGLTLFDAPADAIRDCAGFTVADYAGNGEVLRHVLWPLWKGAFGAGAALLLAALPVAALIGRPRRPLVALSVVGAALVVMYALLPYGALGGRDQPVLAAPNTRYLLPALAAGAVLFACVLPRLGRLRHVVELAAVVLIADGLREGLFIGEGRLAAGVAGVVLLAVPVVAARRLPRSLAVVSVGVVALVVAGLGYTRQRDFYEARYRGSDPALDLLASTPAGTRVGLAGFESRGAVPHVLPAFGRRFGNIVTYVGPTHRGQLRVYERPGPFTAALARGRYEYLLVARERYAVPCALPGEGADPGGWAEAAGWRRLTLSPALALYRRG